MSILQKQLNLIRSSVPGAPTDIDFANKRPSFLFSAKKAATLGNAELLSIALDGLNELIAFDGRFRPFTESLFKSTSVDFNRDLQTKQVNEALDKTLSLLLRLLTPYFQLQCAHKVLEYLIRKYKVHLYNVEAVLECILPHHETTLFARMVQLLLIKDTRWHFLQPIQESGAPLHRDILVQRCRTDISILEFICELMKKAVEEDFVSKSHTSFYTAIVVEFASSLKQLTPTAADAVLKRFLPYVLFGLKHPKNDKEYQMASLMVVTQLCSHVQLSTDFLEKVIITLSTKMMVYNANDFLVAIAYIYQSQKMTRVPTELVDVLVKHRFCLDALAVVGTKYDVFNFMTFFASALLERCITKRDITEIKSVMAAVSLERYIDRLTKSMFQYYRTIGNTDDSAVAFVRTVLKLFSSRFADKVDKGIESALKEVSSAAERAKVLGFLQVAFKGTRHEPLAESSTTLFLSLSHPQPAIRLIAMQHLAHIIDEDPEQMEQMKSFAASAIVSTLTIDESEAETLLTDADSAQLLRFTLQFKHLTAVVDHKALFDAVLSLANTVLSGKIQALNTSQQQSESIASLIFGLLLNKLLPEYPQYVERAVPIVLAYLFSKLNSKDNNSSSNNNNNSSSKSKKKSKGSASQAAAADAGSAIQLGDALDSHPLFVSVSETLRTNTTANRSTALIRQLAKNISAEPALLLPLAQNAMKTNIRSCALLLLALNHTASLSLAEETVVTIAGIMLQSLTDHISHIHDSKKPSEIASEGGLPNPEFISELVDAMCSNDIETVAAAQASELTNAQLQAQSTWNQFVLFTLHNLLLRAAPAKATPLEFVLDELSLREKELDIATAATQHREVSTQRARLLMNAYNAMARSPSEDMLSFMPHLQIIFKQYLSGNTIKFLSSFWMNQAVDAVVAVRSLAIAEGVIDNLSAASAMVVLPSFLVALTSPSADVRSAALACVQQIDAVVNKVETNTKQDKKKRKSKKEAPSKSNTKLELGEFYSQSAKATLTDLSLEDAKVLLKGLLNASNSIAFDHTYLATAFQSLFDSLSANAKQQDTLMTYLMQHIAAFETLYAKYQLLFTLREIHNVAKLATLHKLLQRLLKIAQELVSRNSSDDEEEEEEEELSKYEFKLLASLLALFDNTVLEILNREDQSYFDTLRSAILFYRRVPYSLQSSDITFGFAELSNQQTSDDAMDTDSESEEDESDDDSDETNETKTREFIPCLYVLRFINQSFFSTLNTSKQLALFETLIELLHKAATEKRIVMLVKYLFGRLVVDAKSIVVKTLPSLADKAVDAEAQLQSLSKLLEVLQITPMTTIEALIQPLLKLLNKLKTSVYRNLSANEYTVSQLVTVLFAAVGGKIEDDSTQPQTASDADAVRKALPSNAVELLVDCINEYSDNQLCNYCILILGRIATVSSAAVAPHLTRLMLALQKAMQHDDSFTYSVVETAFRQIVSNVVSEPKQLLNTVTLFVRAFTDIVASRRLDIFSALFDAVVSSDASALHFIFVVFIEHYIYLREEVDEQIAGEVLHFAHELLKRMEALTQLTILLRLATIACSVPLTDAMLTAHRKNSNSRTEYETFFDISELGVDEFRRVAVLMTGFVTDHLSDTNVMKAVVTASRVEWKQSKEEKKRGEEKPQPIQECMASVVKVLLLAIRQLPKAKAAGDSADFIREFKFMLYQALEKAVQLLRSRTFIAIIGSFLKNVDSKLRLKALEVLNAKLTMDKREHMTLTTGYEDGVVQLLTTFKDILLDNQELVKNKQSAVLSIELLARNFIQNHRKMFDELAPVIIEHGVKNSDLNPHLSASSVLCLTSLCCMIGPHSLKYLPKFLPTFRIIFDQAVALRGQDKGIALLYVSLLTSIERLISELDIFVTGYVGDFINVLLHPAILKSSNNAIVEQREIVSTKLLKQFDGPLLLRSFTAQQTLNAAISFGDTPLVKLFTLVGDVIAKLNEVHLQEHFVDISEFFLNAFAIRSQQQQSVRDLNAVEDHIIEIFIKFVLRLNERLFKPLLSRIVDWSNYADESAETPAKKSTNASSAATAAMFSTLDKKIVFYKVITAIQSSLKSIFIPYWTMLLSPCLEELAAIRAQIKTEKPLLPGLTTSTKPQSSSTPSKRGKKRTRADVESDEALATATRRNTLLCNAFTALETAFNHDREKLMQSKGRAEKISAELTEQLTVVDIVGTMADNDAMLPLYHQRMEKHLMPCLAQFVALLPTTMWKDLQANVLSRAQDAQALVRLAAVKTVEAFYDKLRESYLIMLPDMVPYMGELLEDDDERVVEATQQLLKKVEELSGESLQEYFQ